MGVAVIVCAHCPCTVAFPVYVILSGACPGIRKGRGPKSESLFFFFFFFFLLFNFSGGGAAQKIAEKMIFLATKVAKYR